MESFDFELTGNYLSDQTYLPKKVRVFVYSDPVEVWAASWPEELDEGEQFVGIDKEGNEVEYTDADGIAGIKEQGCFGFVKWDKELHIYFDAERADVLDLVQLLGHEIGHLQRPHKRDFMAEEMKAEHYSDFAGYVWRMLDALNMKHEQ